MTATDVSLSSFMPGMSGLPLFVTEPSRAQSSSSFTTIVVNEEASQVESIIHRVSLGTTFEKAKLANRDFLVRVEFKDPMHARLSIGANLHRNIAFSVPVQYSKYKLKIA